MSTIFAFSSDNVGNDVQMSRLCLQIAEMSYCASKFGRETRLCVRHFGMLKTSTSPLVDFVEMQFSNLAI